MRVLSVNCGRAEPMANAKASGVTGIYKRPVATAVLVTTLGLAEDTICDTANHGGADQAIYIYGMPDYAWWSSALQQDLAPGTFGENITIAGLESASMSIGDRLHIGSVTLEVTAPRIPCVTLARRMGDPAFLKQFRAAERPGAYCRVVRTGAIEAGDAVRYEPYAGVHVGLIELFRHLFEPENDEATIRRHLAAPIAVRARQYKETQLARLLAKQA